MYGIISKYIIIYMTLFAMRPTILIAIGVILINYTIRSQSFSVNPIVPTINANTTYSFIIVDINLSNNDGTITIGFPSGLYTLSNLTCFNSDTPTQIFPCSVNSTNRVLITYVRSAFPSQLLSISISTIRNPPSKQPLSFTY